MSVGEEVTFRQTYTHLMAHFTMAFAPPAPEQPHPAPWKSAQAGTTFDILAELHVPTSFNPPAWFNRLNTVWWVAALLRLYVTPLVRVPVVAALPFSSLRDLDQPQVWLIESDPKGIAFIKDAPRSISVDGLDWVKKHWQPGGRLMHDHQNFNIAFQAFDGCHHLTSAPLALVQLWGALEQLFTTSRDNRTRQLTTRIAAFLEPAGTTRALLERQVRNLYAARCTAAHEAQLDSGTPVVESYELLRRVLMQMVEADHVPSRTELEAMD